MVMVSSEQKIIEKIAKDINQEIGVVLGYLKDGQVQDYADYKYFVGSLKGLETAKNICEDVLKKYYSSQEA